MLIKPLITEKSLSRAKVGKYSFIVPKDYSSGKAALAINDAFGVKVGKVWSLKQAGESFLSRTRKKMNKESRKVVVVTLRKGMLDIFELDKDKQESKSESSKNKKQEVVNG